MARRWEASVFLVTEDQDDGTDKIVAVPDFMLRVRRSYQYRLIWDARVGAWRVDRRSADLPAGDTDE